MRKCLASCKPFFGLDACCMWPEVLCGFEELFQRHKELTTRRKRLEQLAKPKIRKPERQTECACKNQPKSRVEIIRLYEPDRQLRTEQLAYPKARNLIEFKKHTSYSSLYDDQKQTVNRMLHKSLTSLYSRLSNVTPPKALKTPKRWTAEDWKCHEAQIKRLANPKGRVKQAKKTNEKISKLNYSRGKDHGKTSGRIKKLAKCKERKDPPVNEWKLTNAMKNFKPSRRLLTLATSTTFVDQSPKLKKVTLRRIDSQRLSELAHPQARRLTWKLEKPLTTPFEVPRRALKAVASERICQLASPKLYLDYHIRPNPFGVRRVALKAKATPRVIQLAQPKVYI